MTNLEKVTKFLQSNKLNLSKEGKKQSLDGIVDLLGVSRANAAVYYSKAIRLTNPCPVATVKKTAVEVEQDLAAVNARIESIIQKSNNSVVTL